MKKLILSLAAALLSLAVVSGPTFAQTIPTGAVPFTGPPATGSPLVTVAPRDLQVAAEADWTSRYVNGLVSQWHSTFGWTPSAPIETLIYRSGIIMASDVGFFRQMPLNVTEMGDANSRLGFTVRDTRPVMPGGGNGGWIITLNVNFDNALNPGSSNTTQNTTLTSGALTPEEQGFLVHELAGLMLQDVAGSGGAAQWLQAGTADLIMNSQVPGLSVTAARQAAASSAAASGTLPGPIALTNSWPFLSTAPANVSDAAYGVADQSAFLLMQKVGLLQVIDIIRRVSAGQDFNTVLQSTTGYTVQTLDSAVAASVAGR